MNRHDIMEEIVNGSDAMEPRERRNLIRELIKRVPDMDLFTFAEVIGITKEGKPA